MDIGELDQLITLESPNATAVEGQVKSTWTRVDVVYGKVISQKGNESFEAARTKSRALIRVKIRFRSDVLPTWRIQWGGKVYGITFVDPSEERKGALWITAESKT